MDISQVLWGLGAVCFTLLSMGPYIWMTLKGRNKPHIFSWIVWAILAVIAVALQVSGGAGAGAWATILTAALCCGIVVVSVKNGETTITLLDWISFILALLILPVWFVTESPVLASVLLVAIDGLGYVPTGMKAWRKPHEEMASAHMLNNMKHGCSLLAMQSFSIPTVLYPACLFLFNLALVAVILGRRWQEGRWSAPLP